MLELAHPALLWLLGLALPLVLLYVLKTRRREKPVPAVWLWESVQRDLEARVPFRRLRRDWLLLLQLLILVLLALAAAEPFRRLWVTPGGQTVVVLDASASLLAEGRFEEARAAAGELIDALGSGDRMALLRAATRAEVLVPLTGDRRLLRAALVSVRPAAVPGELGEAVELAASLAGPEGSVVVVGDGGSVLPKDSEARVIAVGESAANSGIVALGVSAADLSGRDHQVFVRLRNASPEPVRGRLLLRLDERLRDAAEVELAADGEAGHTFELAATAAGLVEVIWQSAGLSRPAADALAADDRAFWVLRPPALRRYRVRGTADPYLRRALAALPDWRPAGDGEAADLEVVVGETPADAEGPPLLWIDPVAGRREAVGAGVVLSWDRTHPALRFVELRAARFGRLHRHPRPAGARVLADTGAGPLILEGLHGARRYLLWAFDPMASDLPLRASFPLLVHNALEHLAPAGGGLPGGLATGGRAPLPWPSAAPVVLRSPSGREVELAPEGGLLRLPVLDEVGFWRLTSPSAAGERELVLAASLLDAGESDLRPPSETAATAGGGAKAGERARSPRAALRGLWRPLALLALALLVLEGTAYHRRWSP